MGGAVAPVVDGDVFPIFLALDLAHDTTVLIATMMFCSLATMAFGLWPALRLSRPDLVSSLKDHAGEISGEIARRITVRGALVTAQLALSLALLVLGGLFVRAVEEHRILLDSHFTDG